MWPPATLLIGDVESYTFIKGGHRTLKTPKVLCSWTDAAEPQRDEGQLLVLCLTCTLHLGHTRFLFMT